MRQGANHYDLRELAGAFGDLGTLVPFVTGYITVTGMDATGTLVTLGCCQMAAGLYFRTPIAVQPMKAIGASAITHPGLITPGAVVASALLTGALWLILGLSGAARWMARITSRPVTQGIVIGLGLAFVVEGVGMMRADPLWAIGAAVATFALLSRRRVPALLIVLAFGIVIGLVRDPSVTAGLADLSVRVRWPELAFPRVSLHDLGAAALVLALPQAALTLGNAVIASVEENNRLFPQRPTSVPTVAVTHGLMNCATGLLGGIPLCHGAGGMAAHVRFGARTGGGLVMLGGLIFAIGFLFGDHAGALLGVIPRWLLGVLLAFAGLELAAGASPIVGERGDRYVVMLTAGVAMWNMGAGYLAGLALWHALQRNWLKP